LPRPEGSVTAMTKQETRLKPVAAGSVDQDSASTALALARFIVTAPFQVMPR
jgi:hypothetical protein